MRPIPADDVFDGTLALLRDGYRFIGRRCRRHRSDIFRTRLLFRPAVCMQGEAAARLFYDPAHFVREGAVPAWLRKPLFGLGGVQGLDGAAHHRRKQMFMDLMTPAAIDRLADLFAEEWRRKLADWQVMERIVLFDEVRQVLCRAVCRWTGVPLAEAEAAQRARDLGAMIDGVGSVGWRQLQSRLGRRRTNAWIGGRVREARAEADGGASPLSRIALFRESTGDLLTPHAAAVEVINLLRPTVAIGYYITFAALALHRYPHTRQALALEGGEAATRFVQEVRRFYPFFPFVAAVVRKTFTWNGYRFPRGTRVLLDLYGTDHDDRRWEAPERFDPDRFRHREENPFDFIPQGGGDHHRNHRCPGEWVTIAVMARAVELLRDAMTYQVPDQDFTIDLSRMPARPKSGFVISAVRPK